MISVVVGLDFVVAVFSSLLNLFHKIESLGVLAPGFNINENTLT